LLPRTCLMRVIIIISSSCLHGWTTLVTTRVIFIALHTTILNCERRHFSMGKRGRN
jgi:hypothetical protein